MKLSRPRPAPLVGVDFAAVAWRVALCVMVGTIWAAPGRAACLELSDADIQRLDQLRLENPARALRLAQERLNAARPQDLGKARAELQVVAALALGKEGRAADARAALATARREVQALPAGAARHTLELKLAVGAFGVAKTQSEYEQAMRVIDTDVREATPDTLDWACLLITRGDLQAELDWRDLAVVDQLTAYHAAVAHGWVETAAAAALSLATNYRRSALWADAEAKVEEVIDYSRDHELTWLLALAELTKGQIYVNERRWDPAFAALSDAQRLAAEVDDTLIDALATLRMCDALITSGQVNKARGACSADYSTFLALGRSDLVTESQINSARVELIDRRYGAALATLDGVLSERLGDVPARYKPQLYRQRADALAALGRYRDASADFDRSLSATENLAKRDRDRAVAVLSGISKTQALEESNHALELQNQAQRERLDSQQRVRRLSISLAFAGLAASGLLGFFLYLGQRYRRELGDHVAVLATLTQNLPDTVMLLDREQKVLFANRSLRGGPQARGGCPIEEMVPAEAAEQFRRCLARVIHSREALEFEATWFDEEAQTRRYFEQHATPVVANDRLVGVTLRATDVTARRALEHELRLRAKVLESMNEGVVAVDERGRITLANGAMGALLGLAAEEIIGRPMNSMLAAGETLPRTAKAPSPASALGTEAVLRHKDGSDRLVAYASSRLTFASDTIQIYVFRDISGQRQIERVLAGAATRDALRIGNRLHEGLAQELAGVSFLLSTGTRQPETFGGSAPSGSNDVERHLINAIGTAREMARMVSPMSTVSGSLELALQSLMDEAARHLGVPAQCSARTGGRELDAATADQMYRIAQIAVQYAARRRCASISLRLDGGGDQTRLSIRWDRPAQLADRSERHALELELIGYRTRLLGGTCDYDDSIPNAEAIAVTVRLPDEAAPVARL